jgi:hypothetical protein
MNPFITKRCSPIEEAIYQDGFRAGATSRDAEIAELAAALEDNWNCNPCETTRQQKAFDVAQSVLAKVRKP